MQLTTGQKGQVVFVWAASQKAAATTYLKRMLGADATIVLMKPGTSVASLSDDDLANNGLRRLTKEEFLVVQENQRAAAAAVAVPVAAQG